jgi:hypothetical protein
MNPKVTRYAVAAGAAAHAARIAGAAFAPAELPSDRADMLPVELTTNDVEGAHPHAPIESAQGDGKPPYGPQGATGTPGPTGATGATGGTG